ncbi:hypothetical protein [Bartonella tribocorum]|uniref:hypothetical protein n=1 Tax=Bartonella tribocorum TaxID=85701 RepID=UPI001ABB33A1|nr:hypothetical protein [Bartonella tribocorum]
MVFCKSLYGQKPVRLKQAGLVKKGRALLLKELLEAVNRFCAAHARRDEAVSEGGLWVIFSPNY